MATSAQIAQFLGFFYQSWDNSIKDRQAYNTAIAIAETRTGLQIGRAINAPAGINLNFISPNDIPSFASLSGAAPSSSTSAAQTVQDDAVSNPTANPQLQAGANGRVSTAPASTAPSNAVATPTLASGGGDSGTNGNTVTLQQSQATSNSQQNTAAAAGAPTAGGATPAPPIGTGFGDDQAEYTTDSLGNTFKDGTLYRAAEVDESPPVAPGSTLPPGTGFGDDPGEEFTTDSLGNTYKNGKLYRAAEVDDSLAGPTVGSAPVDTGARNIIPQPNALDGYASYTWSASVYLLSPTQYTTLLRSKIKNLNGYQLLFQSAGAPTGGRSPSFPNDFYMDNIVMNNSLPGQVTGAAHMVTDLKFTVYEPNGITLLDRLYEAVQKFQVGNYTACQYLMVMRFYGYDANGNLVGGSSTAGNQGIDGAPVIEKFIPFIISQIKWSVQSKIVQYDFECAPVGQLVGGTTARGTVPYDTQLVSSTVEGMLSGDVTATTQPSNAPAGAVASTPAPDKANAASAKRQGLMAAMNEYQAQLVKEGIYKYPDQYSIEFAKGAEAIKGAKIQLPGNKQDKDSTGGDPPATENPQALLPEKQRVDLTSRKFSITAGQQIIQAIDLVIRNSHYILDQALTSVDSSTGLEELNAAATTKEVSWFQITMEAQPRQYDPNRNDFAYDIKFVISKYLLQDLVSLYFPLNNFRGVHKSYEYWFTGKNTAVIDYTANFDALYNITVTGDNPEKSGAAKIREAFTSSMRDIPKIVYASRSTESVAGAPSAPQGSGLEVSANLAEYLYDPSSLGSTKLRIIGDPAWIQQGSLYRGVNAKEFDYSAFLPDGTINFDSQQVMFEIAWQRPEDYDLGTGLADPYSRTQNFEGSRQPVQSYVYLATQCVSEFKGGKFEQTIEGSLYMLPKRKKPTNAARPSATGFGDDDTSVFPSTQPNRADGQGALINPTSAVGFGDDPGEEFTTDSLGNTFKNGTLYRAAEVTEPDSNGTAVGFGDDPGIEFTTDSQGNTYKTLPDGTASLYRAAEVDETDPPPAPPKIGQTTGPTTQEPEIIAYDF